MKTSLFPFVIQPNVLDFFLNKMENPCLLITQAGVIKKTNNIACQKFGYLSQKMLHKKIFDLIPGIGELNKMSVSDPEGNTSITYTDKRGRTILSKVEKGTASTETGYVYDDKDRVRTVLPPGVLLDTSPLAYQYIYDGDDNITEKYIPDMGWTEMLYDDRNLLTASRDSNLIYDNKWLSSINDDYGRMIQTGFHDIGLSGTPNPNVPAIDHLLTETYYDKTCGQTADQFVGKVCQNRSRILGTNDWLEDNMAYDIYGRIIYSEGNNHLDLASGSEKDSIHYDYADNITRIRREHQAFGNTQTIIERIKYDHEGRVKDTYHKYNGEGEEWLTNSSYTIKDELDIKKMGVANGGVTYLEKVDYDYLPNRFLTEMSGNLFDFALLYDNISPAYNATPYKNGNIATQVWQVQGKDAQFYNYQYDYLNRLTQADYKSITSTGNIDHNNHYNASYSYDPQGNILSLNRQGQLPNNSFGQIDSLDYDYYGTSNQLKTISDLTVGTGLEKGFKLGVGGDYEYDENGNLSYDPHKDLTIHYNFLNLPDTITKPGGDTIIWVYDATGVKLQKKVISTGGGAGTLYKNENPIASGTYNADKITSAGIIPSGNSVRFEAGQQIKLQSGFKGKGQFAGLAGITSGPSIISQDYCTGIEYKDGVLEAIYHSEGRIHFIIDTVRYEYVLSDHLGNQRVLFSDTNGDGSIDANSEVLQTSAYYPFGMRMEGDFVQNPGREDKYLYNGKELDTDFGLNWYHYGARMYDPAVGRFPSIDRFAEKFSYQSPYIYAGNNPISFIDVNGDSLKVNGSQDAINDFQNLIFNGTGGHFSASVDGNGNVSVSENDVPDSEMSKTQLNFLSRLSTIIDSDKTTSFSLVNHKDKLSQNIFVGDNGASSISATPGVHTVDVGDMKKVGNQGLITGPGMLMHEVNEGYRMQVHGDSPMAAHRAGITQESRATGVISQGASLNQSRTELRINVLIPKSGSMPQKRTVIIKMRNGNITKIGNNQK